MVKDEILSPTLPVAHIASLHARPPPLQGEAYLYPHAAVDAQDLADCELLGVSPTCSERVARLAFRAFAEAHHPDRPGGNEETFKLGQAAFERICQRRGWHT